MLSAPMLGTPSVYSDTPPLGLPPTSNSPQDVLQNVYTPTPPESRPTRSPRRRSGKRSAKGLGQAGVAAFGLGADGVEVHEPRLEERPRHRLQRLVHPPVQLDLVVQRAEDVGDGALLVERRDGTG